MLSYLESVKFNSMVKNKRLYQVSHNQLIFEYWSSKLTGPACVTLRHVKLPNGTGLQI